MKASKMVWELCFPNSWSSAFAKGCSFSFPSISTKLYLTSFGKVGTELYIKKKSQNFVEACFLTICANKAPSNILGQSQGFPLRTFTNMSLWWSYPAVDKTHLIGEDTPKSCAAQYRSCYVNLCYLHASMPTFRLIR